MLCNKLWRCQKYSLVISPAGGQTLPSLANFKTGPVLFQLRGPGANNIKETTLDITKKGDKMNCKFVILKFYTCRYIQSLSNM